MRPLAGRYTEPNFSDADSLSFTGVFMRFLSIALAALIATLGALSFNASAADAKLMTVAALNQSKPTAKVGDQVTISGVVVVNKDFGSGYSYPVLIEEASITVKK